VNEVDAWIDQAYSDYQCINRVLVQNDSTIYCHAIAKSQQCVEKSVKAIARHRGMGIGRAHGVHRLAQVFRRTLKRGQGRDINHQILGLLDADTVRKIRDLDQLAPAWPSPGSRFARNTEYPYQIDDADWLSPSASNAFSPSEVERFRQLAHRVVDRSRRIISASKRVE